MNGASRAEQEEDGFSLHTDFSLDSQADNELPRPQSLHHNVTKEREGNLSKKSTLRDKNLTVARNQRRGVLANFSLVPEYKDARDYPPKLKAFIIFLIAYAAMMGPMGTSIIFPSITSVSYTHLDVYKRQRYACEICQANTYRIPQLDQKARWIV